MLKFCIPLLASSSKISFCFKSLKVSTRFNCVPCSSSVSICFPSWSLTVFIRFSKDFPRGKYVNLAYSIILLWTDDNISLPVRSSYLSILPDDNTDIFVAFLLILYCSFSSLVLSHDYLLYSF